MRIECPVDSIRNMSPDEVARAIKKEEILLIDVREDLEFQRGHINGAIHIPLRELEYRREEIPRDKKVILYCRTGNRSTRAAMILCSYGYKNAVNMSGGIIRWPGDTSDTAKI